MPAISSGGGMLLPAGSGSRRMRGKQGRPSCRGCVRCAKASIGRCFLMGGDRNGAPPVQGEVDR